MGAVEAKREVAGGEGEGRGEGTAGHSPGHNAAWQEPLRKLRGRVTPGQGSFTSGRGSLALHTSVLVLWP